MTQWDFTADLDRLLTQVRCGDAPRTMSSMISTANELVEQARRHDPRGLEEWLVDNAETLVGQQLLVANVHAQQAPQTALHRALDEWADQSGVGSAADAVEWLKEEYPGLLRAWLLTKVDMLIAEEITRP